MGLSGLDSNSTQILKLFQDLQWSILSMVSTILTLW